MSKLLHVNINAKDWKKVAAFYEKVFGCVQVPPEKKISGDYAADLTGLAGSDIEGITMTFICIGFKLASVKDSSGYMVSNVSESGFTIYRNGHFNPNERIEFNIQITAADSPYHGSVAQTGQVCPHKVVCTSYITC